MTSDETCNNSSRSESSNALNDNINNLPLNNIKLNTIEGYTEQLISEVFQYKANMHKLKQNINKWKKDRYLIKSSIDQGMGLTSSTMHKYSQVLLSPEVLVIAKSKVDTNNNKKKIKS